MKNLNWVFMLLWSLMTFQKYSAQTFTLPVCSSTPSNTYSPMNSVTAANSKNRIAFIIPATQLQMIEGGKITSIYFKRVTAAGTLPAGSNFKIYMKSTADLDLGTNDLDWDAQVASSVLVYDADPSAEVGSTAGYKQFVLTNDFTFDAGKNFQIMCQYEQTTGPAANITWDYEFANPCVDITNSNTTKFWTGTGPFASTISGTNYRRPVVGFDFVLQDPVTEPACATGIVPANNATNVSVAPTISWNMVGGLNSASSYLLYLGTTPGGTDVLNGLEVTSLNHQIPAATPLNYSSTYYLKIVPKNSIGEATGCTEYTFTTQSVPCPTILTPQVDATEQSLMPTITWTALPGVTSYKLTVGTTAGGNDVLNAVDLGNVTTYTFASPLNTSTKYYYKLTAQAGAVASSACTERNFTTTCPSVTDFFENFDSYPVGNIVPDCWVRMLPVPTNTAGSMSIASTSPFSGTRNIYLMTGTNSKSIVIALPNMSNINAGTHRLKLKARISSGSGALHIGYVTDINDTNSFNLIQAITVANTSYTANGDYAVNIPTSVPANTKLAIRTASDGKSYYIDDVIWEKIPTCYPPTNVIVTSTTTTTADVNWSNPATPPTNPNNGYEIYYSPNNVAPTATTTPLGTSATTSFVITGLNPSSTYFVWVRSKCAANDASAWSNALAFNTACGPVDNLFENFEASSTGSYVPNCWMRVSPILTPNGSQTISTLSPFSGTKNLYLKTDVGSHSIVVVLPEFSNMNAGTHWLRMKARVVSGTGALMVGYLTDILDAASFVTVQTLNFNNTSYATGLDKTVEIPTNIPAGSRLAFKVADNGVAHYIDDVYWEAKPSCIAPINVTATNVTQNTADLSWTAPLTAPAGYDVYYSTSNTAPTATTTPTTTATGTTTALSGLASSTFYYVWVRSNCGASTSPWTLVYSFGTQCGTSSVPYVQDFESSNVPGLPICTTSENAGTGNNWATVNNPGNGFTSKTLRYGYNSDNNANAWFYTNGINLVAGVNYKITFEYGNTDDLMIEKLKVAFGTSANAAAMTNQIVDYPNVTGGLKQNASHVFTVPTSGVYYFGFNAYSDMDQFNLYVDNISINVDNLATTEVAGQNNLKLYPNPFTDKVMLSDSKNVKSIVVSDAAGRMVKTIAQPKSEIQLGDLQSGMYIISIQLKDGSTQSFKVLKK